MIRYMQKMKAPSEAKPTPAMFVGNAPAKMPNMIITKRRVKINPEHKVKSILVCRAKSVSIRTSTTVMPTAIKTSCGYF